MTTALAGVFDSTVWTGCSCEDVSFEKCLYTLARAKEQEARKQETSGRYLKSGGHGARHNSGFTTFAGNFMVPPCCVCCVVCVFGGRCERYFFAEGVLELRLYFSRTLKNFVLYFWVYFQLYVALLRILIYIFREIYSAKWQHPKPR